MAHHTVVYERPWLLKEAELKLLLVSSSLLPFDYAHGAHRSHYNAPTVRIRVCFPLSHLPLRLCLHPSETVSPSLFSTSEFFFAFGASGQPADKPSVGPWPSPCRVAPARSTRVFFVVWECVSVTARPPSSSVCVCVILSCAGFFALDPHAKRSSKKFSFARNNNTPNQLNSPCCPTTFDNFSIPKLPKDFFFLFQFFRSTWFFIVKKESVMS